MTRPNPLRILNQHRWPVFALIVVLGGYWLLPISGRITILAGNADNRPWPQIQVQTPAGQSLQANRIVITDVQPWSHVLLTIDGRPATMDDGWANAGGTWSWEWNPPGPPGQDGTIVFYHSCDTGCVERGRFVFGNPAEPAEPPELPTKLGVAFADPERDWHGRSGWDVELTYARPNAMAYWGIDELAGRVQQAARSGLRVLVRVDYDQGQSLPPAGDELALAEYLGYLRRLARDARLADTYGYVIGSGYNALDSNSQAQQPVTPAWYARVFNGYGEDPRHADNAVQVLHSQRPQVRVLVGPVRPWAMDQDGTQPSPANAPWLNYMNTLVAALNDAVQAKEEAGLAQVAPDGFAVQAPGRPDAAEMVGQDGAQEPTIDLTRAAWGGAQAGFRVYRDWLDIINAYPATRGLPIYITSANTFAPDDGTPPAQNYPSGWLTAALKVVDAEPQIQALIWFMDGPLGDAQWDFFSLAKQQGRMQYAADEFDRLLRGR